MKIGSKGVEIGEVLEGFQGVLSGIPRFLGKEEELLSKPETP